MHFPGDTLSVTVQSRYLFGAPMGRAVVGWLARMDDALAVGAGHPRHRRLVHRRGRQLVGGDANAARRRQVGEGKDTLDVRGERTLRVPVPAASKGRAANLDRERRRHRRESPERARDARAPSCIRPSSTSPQSRAARATSGRRAVRRPSTWSPCVRPARACPASTVRGTVVRREWHQVRRERDGVSELVGEWVADTVATCAVTTASDAGAVRVHAEGGRRVHRDVHRDRRQGQTRRRRRSGAGPPAATGCRGTTRRSSRWTSFPTRRAIPSATPRRVLFASPFTNAEAWITVEREGIIEQRRIRITSGLDDAQVPDHRSVRAERVRVDSRRARAQRAARAARRSRPSDDSRRLRQSARHARGEAADRHARRRARRNIGPATRRASACRCATRTGRARAAKSRCGRSTKACSR